MKRDKQKHNWIIDAVLFGGFLGSLWLDLTGVAAHQWLGLAVATLAGYHLWAHWSWVKAVTARFFDSRQGASSQARLFYVVDAGLVIGFAAIGLTGLVISTWLDLSLANYASWLDLHVVASVGTLALLVAKIGLHWRWIIGVARRSILPQPTPAVRAGSAAPAPVAVPARMGRRDFVRLMAGVGAVALLSGANALSAVTGERAEASAETQAATVSGGTATNTTAQAAAGATSGSASSTCRVRCNKRCSYPGHCRRYTDSNRNGRCDLGECLA